MSATYLAATYLRAADARQPCTQRLNEDPKPLSPAAPARPLRHVVSFKCSDWSPAKAEELGAALNTLPASVKELGAFHHGPDMGLREPGYNMDYTMTADFADQASYLAFCHHPAYLKVVNEVIKPLLAPGEPVARMQFKMEHYSRARQTLMRADPALFDIRFGKAVREPGSPSRALPVESTHSPSSPSLHDRASPDPKPLSPAAPARPLRHVVSFKCSDWSPAKAEELGAALNTLPASVKELGAFHHGPDMGLREPGYNMDYTMTADFADQASYLAFCHHPAYLKVVNEVIKPLLAPGEPVARMQFKMEHYSRARQTLMRADPALFDIRFGKAVREPGSPESVILA